MAEYNITGATARWSVIWLVKRRGKRQLIEHEFGNDLNEAVRVYMLAKNAGKPFATLRCCNVGFPPPDKYRPHLIKVRKEKYVIVKRKGRKYRKKKVWYDERLINRMIQANERGVWWCPYCREFRRFQKQDGFHTEKMGYTPIEGMHCPICGISHRDWHVRKWNPQASVYYVSPPWRRRRSNGKRNTRRRTRSR